MPVCQCGGCQPVCHDDVLSRNDLAKQERETIAHKIARVLSWCSTEGTEGTDGVLSFNGR